MGVKLEILPKKSPCVNIAQGLFCFAWSLLHHHYRIITIGMKRVFGCESNIGGLNIGGLNTGSSISSIDVGRNTGVVTSIN